MAADDDEDFVYFGSALDPLEGDESTKNPVPLHEQTVRDEKGRYKRFHGAFTGGFSAGYFNSVGSKEGWTPSTFVSSRQQKADKQVFNPEHFMDEEDLEEHGIAPKGITTTDEFASKAKDKIWERSQALASLVAPIPGASILDDLIAPAKITIGVQLLRKMGWKEGQGLGPRVKRKLRRQQPETGVKVYGCSLPDEGSDGSQEEEDEYQPENVTFAPKDVVVVDFTSKDDRNGLGYSGIDPRRALFGASRQDSSNIFNTDSDRASSLLGDIQPSVGRKLGISGQAFGVGALEQEDDDIYARDTLSQYDTVLREEEPEDGLYGWTAPQQYKNTKGSIPHAGSIGKMLAGFCLGSKSAKPKKVYGPPDLPRDYRPVHYFRPVVVPGTVSTIVAQALDASTGQHGTETGPRGRHQLNATQRRQLLGETALQGPSSVFELLTVKDKERLQQEAVSRKLPVQSQAPASEKPSDSQLPALGARLTSSSEFKPFLKNPEKQKRYEEYVEKLNSGQSSALASCLDPNMTEWEREREQYEFSRAAMLYRSTSASLSSRFTRAMVSDDKDTVEVIEQQESDVNDQEAAVKMKMFGRLTRDKFEWHPEKLLCKRFNVPDPYPGSTKSGLLKVKRDKYSVFNFLNVHTAPEPQKMESKTETIKHTRALKPPESRRPSRWDVSAEDKEKGLTDHASGLIGSDSTGETSLTQHTEKEVHQGSETETVELEDTEGEGKRPSMDLFKAIFTSSSEEKSSSSSSEEDEGEDTSEVDPAPGGLVSVQSGPPNPPADLQPVKELDDGRPQSVQCSPENPKGGEEFGPQLPPALCFGNTKPSPDDTVVSPVTRCKWLEEGSSGTAQHKGKPKKKHKDRKEKKAKKEKKKKHKKHKHKSKLRGRKQKDNESSSGDSESEQSDGASDHTDPQSVSDTNLLMRLKVLPLVRR
ncbi:G patch domain-containing protein 1 isoform X1 [Chiloscyllium punctatum]